VTVSSLLNNLLLAYLNESIVYMWTQKFHYSLTEKNKEQNEDPRVVHNSESVQNLLIMCILYYFVLTKFYAYCWCRLNEKWDVLGTPCSVKA